MKDLAIIIVNWNTKSLLRDCLNSIIQQTNKCSYDIYVVDNNSPDNSALMVKNEFPSVKLIENNHNAGFAAGNNQALKIAKANKYLLLNPDTEIIENAIDKMISYMDKSEYHIVTCKLINSDGSLQKSVNSFYSFWKTLLENRFSNIILDKLNLKQKRLTSFWDHDSIREIDWARGAVVLFSADVLKNIGLLDERFFIYGEEIDFFYRANKMGYKSVFIPDAVIKHHGKASSKQKRAQMFIQNYKSFYLFLKKNYSFFSYYLYRFRANFLILSWIIYYSLFSQFKKSNPDFDEQLSVYRKTLRWHFSKDSFIKL